MKHRPIVRTGRAYAQAGEGSDYRRLLFISGQVPENERGEVPIDFDWQCRLAWANIDRRLKSAGMTFDNLIKVTTFLADRSYRDAKARIRKEMLGDRSPALPVVIAVIYDERWLLEIEAVAGE